MKRFVLMLVVVVLLFSFSSPAWAHPGRTDSNGGHTDRSAGEYHYHHGYPTHDHYDMDGDGIVDCPYEFDDKTVQNSGSISDESSVIDSKKDKGFVLGAVAIFALLIFIFRRKSHS